MEQHCKDCRHFWQQLDPAGCHTSRCGRWPGLVLGGVCICGCGQDDDPANFVPQEPDCWESKEAHDGP